MKRTVLILVICLCLLLCGCSKESSDTFFAMDTVISITVSGDSEVIKEVRGEVEKLEGLFSVTRESSEISQLNQNKTVSPTKDTREVISKAVEISSLTDGAFDITIYPLVKEWGFTTDLNKVPSKEDIGTALNKVGYGQIEFSDSEISIKDGEVDLGGIAKGYACSKIREILKSKGIGSAVISMGGNVMVYGNKSNGKPWKVGLQHPLDSSALIGTLNATDVSVVTSGGYQRYFEESGKRYHHIIDPKTGEPSDSGLISASIITDDDTAADALSTAIYVMGKERATELWRQNRDFDMVLVTDSEVYITSGIADDFTLSDTNFILKTIE